MTYHLVAGGYRKSIALLSFEPSTAKIKVVSESPTPENPSWVELAGGKSQAYAPTEPVSVYSLKRELYRPGGSPKTLFSLSEAENGAALSLELKDEKLTVTGERATSGGPAHIHALKDGSGIIAANYIGGSVVFFPLVDGKLSPDSASPVLKLPFAYEGKAAPNPKRQDSAHAHHTIEDDAGNFYVADLGSDRIYIVRRDGADALKIVDYIQAPPGSGPRHLVISQDKKHLYALCEMGHNVVAFPLPDATSSTQALTDFDAPILPPSVPASHARFMDSAELAVNPAIPGVLYASNRLELHANEQNPEYPPIDLPEGDAIAIFLLSDDGAKVQAVKHVRTGLDGIRAMQVSPDGKYVAAAGQSGGGVEIWAVHGDRGDEWKLAGKEEGIENVTDFAWL
ncbi:hypothetical protein Q5752_002776 [Cryptotrichosporon argae]